MSIKYFTKSFQELSVDELYSILQLRSEVFVVEQNCVYQDIDGKDLKGYHLMCYADGRLAGYTRLLPAGISYREVSIGRVVIGAQYRGLKLGKQLMEQSIIACGELFEYPAIRISAQAHLSGFYNTLGFEEVGEPYDEDGIPHRCLESSLSQIQYIIQYRIRVILSPVDVQISHKR